MLLSLPAQPTLHLFPRFLMISLMSLPELPTCNNDLSCHSLIRQRIGIVPSSLFWLANTHVPRYMGDRDSM